MPTTFSGRLEPLAISPIGIADVLVAKMACSGRCSSTAAMTLCLRLRSSNTASMTMSTPLKCFPHDGTSSPRPTMLAMVLSLACLVIRFRLTALSKFSWIIASPRPAASRSRSFSSTRRPAFLAVTCAIPAPMRPAPSTATVLVSCCGAPNGLFFIAVMPSKSPISPWLSLVCAISTKRFASYSSPAFLLPLSPSLTQSSTAYAAGYLPSVALVMAFLAWSKSTYCPTGLSSRSLFIRLFFFFFGFRLPSARPRAASHATCSRMPGSQIWSIRPDLIALAGFTLPPMVIILIASCTPTSGGRFCVPPAPGKSPSLISGTDMTVFLWLVATR
mmetsp:Transcript_78639/g.225242  ORF Transcript_78639/g.225242 Transcript_78639/m.225242 type:complete len:331 (+) Transcript_78639:42-1034(+)